MMGHSCVCVQLQNQDSIRSLLKRTETELSLRLSDALRKQEDPLQRQRLLVEEERLKYLNEEELIIQQLQCVSHTICADNVLIMQFWGASTVTLLHNGQKNYFPVIFIAQVLISSYLNVNKCITMRYKHSLI